eukprot:g49570.t1
MLTRVSLLPIQFRRRKEHTQTQVLFRIVDGHELLTREAFESHDRIRPPGSSIRERFPEMSFIQDLFTASSGGSSHADVVFVGSNQQKDIDSLVRAHGHGKDRGFISKGSTSISQLRLCGEDKLGVEEVLLNIVDNVSVTSVPDPNVKYIFPAGNPNNHYVSLALRPFSRNVTTRGKVEKARCYGVFKCTLCNWLGRPKSAREQAIPTCRSGRCVKQAQATVIYVPC